MKLFYIGLITVAVVCFGGAGQEEKPAFLSTVKAGTSVTLKEVAGRFEISTFDVDRMGRLGHKITLVGNDFITVEDIAGVTETRIPVYSIKSFVTVKLPKNR